MRRPSTRQITIPLVVLLVALAGCSGGGGGDGGDAATPTVTPTDDAGTSPTATATESGDSPTTTAAATPTDDDPSTQTSDPGTTTESSGGSDFSLQRHSAAVQQAGSYTIEYKIDGLFGGASGGSSNTVLEGTQKAIVSSGEYYAEVSSSSGEQAYSLEYYRPPNSNTVYQYVGGQTRETTMSQALVFNFSTLATTTTAEEFPNLRKAGTAQTSLGPATKYVVDSVEQLPDSTQDQYGNIKDVSFVLFVDQDTGIIAKYDYQLTYEQEGEESSIQFVIEVTDLGSTSIEKPSWAPS